MSEAKGRKDEEIRQIATEPQPDHIAVRLLTPISVTVETPIGRDTISGKAGDVAYIPIKLYEYVKDHFPTIRRCIEPVEGVEKPVEKVETKVLSDGDCKKLWIYFEEMITKKFKLNYRYVYAYKDEFTRIIDRTKTFEENLKLVDKLLEKIAKESLTRRAVIVPSSPPPVKIPKEPIEPMSFPRRLASSEIEVFMNEFKRRLIDMGLNPDDYIHYWIAFRDAWHDSWKQVLKRFEELIDAIKSGLPPPEYPRPMLYPWGPWKEIPKDVILHRMWLQAARDMDTFVKVVNEDLEEVGMTITPEDVKRIVKEEWKKGEKMHAWLKLTPREYIKKILGVDPEDC